MLSWRGVAETLVWLSRIWAISDGLGRIFVKKNGFTVVLWVLYGIAIGLFLFFLIRGGMYYLTPLAERPRHPEYRVLKPAGSLGLVFGLVGAVMMLSLLFYSVRKRTGFFGRLFRLKYWLDIHILFGVAGPCFILLHTSFKLGGLVSVSFWSMIAVACSGVFGRYLYIQIPRNIRGDELSMQDLEKRDQELTEAFNKDFGLTPADLEKIMGLLQGKQAGSKISPFQMIAGDLVRKWRSWSAGRIIRRDFPGQAHNLSALVQTVTQKALLQIRIARLREVHRWFHYWHVIHRPFAFIMYLIMFIHIGVALLFGISWRGGS